MPLPKAILWTEFLVLFAVLPAVVWTWGEGGGSVPVFPLLWTITGYCVLMLRREGSFAWRTIFGWRGAAAHLPKVLLRFVVIAGVLAGVIAWRWPELFLNFPRQRPQLWAIVMLLYPILSVLPQGIVYRVFVVRRYAGLFGQGLGLTLAGAMAFAWVHVIFANAVAAPMTLLGGWLFVNTYRRSGSPMLAWLEHALYGCMIFTVGLGRFFYHGGS